MLIESDVKIRQHDAMDAGRKVSPNRRRSMVSDNARSE